MSRRGVGTAAVAVIGHPSLWGTALVEYRRLVPDRWWRVRPWLPVPDPAVDPAPSASPHECCPAGRPLWWREWLCGQALSLPSWLDLVFVVCSIAGLPIVILLSWVFEWSPAGLVIDDRDTHLQQSAQQSAEQRRELARQIAREVHQRLISDLRSASHKIIDSK